MPFSSIATIPGRSLTLGMVVFCLLGAAGCQGRSEETRDAEPAGVLHYSEMCDASAGAMLDSASMVVANDEDNILRVYRTERSGPPFAVYDLNQVIAPLTKKPEMDLEGGARLGERIFWIASHGRNTDGKWRPDRQVLFATALSTAPTSTTRVHVTGLPYRNLTQALLDAPSLATLPLRTAIGGQETDPRLAPKAQGLNIEGLAATPEGGLLIGLRNPLAQKKAILIPLLNPVAVIEQKAPPHLGEPILLDLGGHGIRDIVYLETQRQYIILAGTTGEGRDFSLWRWPGQPGAAPQEINGIQWGTMHPEALVVDSAKGQLHVLSDDGTQRMDGILCKKLADPAQRNFRARTFELGPLLAP